MCKEGVSLENAYFNNIADLIVKYGIKLLVAVLVLVIGIKLSKWSSKLLSRSKALSSLDSGVVRFISNTVKFTLYVMVVISAAGILGIPYASFVAVLGSAGVAIGLALQGSLSNIASGILILVNKPFRVGDYIQAGTIEGNVTDIGFFNTSVITLDNKVISIPNSVLTGSCIINYTAMETRRVDITFSVGYESDIENVKSVILETVNKSPLILKDPKPIARLIKCGDSSLDFTVRAWCKTKDYWDAYFEINESIKQALDKNNIEIPFPKLDVSIKNK